MKQYSKQSGLWKLLQEFYLLVTMDVFSFNLTFNFNDYAFLLF